MDISDRIKFIRLVNGYRQADVADILDVSQNTIGKYEKGKARIRNFQLEKFCDFFNCNKAWILDGKPPAYDCWEYWELPPKTILKKEKTIKTRQIGELKECVALYLSKFLAENKASEYILGKIKNKNNLLFLLKITKKNFIIINTDATFIDVVKKSFEKLSLKKEITINKSTKSDIFADLLKKSDLDASKQFFKITQKKQNNYQSLLIKTARLIIKENLKIADVADCVKKLKNDV